MLYITKTDWEVKYEDPEQITWITYLRSDHDPMVYEYVSLIDDAHNVVRYEGVLYDVVDYGLTHNYYDDTVYFYIKAKLRQEM